MTIQGLFDIGKSALFASQTALTVTSNNIANANTLGYNRQDVVLSIANPVSTGAGMIGRGVVTEGIRSSYDKFIEAQLLGQQQNQGSSAAMDQAWGQIEQVFNEAKGIGLSSSLTDYFNAWQDVASNPASQPPRTVLLQKAQALVTSAQTMERSMLYTLNDTNTGITDGARQVNQLATNIAELNQRITQQESGSGRATALDLRDQRGQKMNELAKLVDFSSFEDNNGAVTITVGMRNLVYGATTNPMSTKTNADGNQDLYLDGINITGNIRKGQLNGLIAARNDIQSSALAGLRKLVGSITQQVNALHRTGYGLDGSTGTDFFTPLQVSTTTNSSGATVAAAITDPDLLTLDEYRITVDAGNNVNIANKQTGALVIPPAPYVSGGTISLPGVDVTITGAVASTDVFSVSPLTGVISSFGVNVTDAQQIAATTSAAQLPGDNSNAVQISQLANAAQSAIGNNTFSGYYGGLVSTVGVMKQSAADSLSFDNNLLSALQAKRDSVSGVSLDEEAANLIRYQRSYEAAARTITIADELMQTILKL
jgi:flagellar hook-associated protein 1 FlgK